jgi:hypothetical protein
VTVTVRYARTESYSRLRAGEPYRPYLAVRIQSGGRHFDTVAIVDSGADSTVFDKQLAAVLGLSL